MFFIGHTVTLYTLKTPRSMGFIHPIM